MLFKEVTFLAEVLTTSILIRARSVVQSTQTHHLIQRLSDSSFFLDLLESMIRQCRKAKSKGSSFFSEKSTLKVGLSLVCVILHPLSQLPPTKKPSDTVALLALPITRQSVTCASGAFRPICLVQRASNNRSADLPVRRLPTRLTDARGAVGWRSAFGAPSHWFLSSAHARSLLRRFVTE
jgi:hypothetical protein